MERIGSEVSRELRRFGPAAGMADVVATWPAAVGEAIAANAWPARLSRDGTLHVATSSSAWSFELGQLAPVLLERLREALGEATPAALRFQPGRIPDRTASPSEGAPATVQAGPEERELAAALASTIEDQALRDLVARAAAASLARRASSR